MYWPTDHTSAQNHDGLELSAATYNIGSLHSQSVLVVDMLKSLDVELVGIQELGRRRAITLRQELSGKYPYQVFFFAPQLQGIGLLSQYPVLEQYVTRSTNGNIRYMRVVLDVAGERVVVYVFHPKGPANNTSPLTYDDQERGEAVDALRMRIVMENDPILILCDCNFTDQSDDYRKLDRILEDSFRDAGWGLGFTFSPQTNFRFLDPVPVVRLDYIWHNSRFASYDAYVVSATGSSDHHPVVAQLILKQTGPEE
jgi:vancomycin resistance protein VanJ